MKEILTKTMARNIYYGGSLFFIFVFLALTFHTTYSLPKRDNRDKLTPQVAAGKAVWEENDCIGCHTILGEGAYFAPELGNVYKRRGGDKGGKEFIKAWMQGQPTKAPGRRQMPHFAFVDDKDGAKLDALVEFLKWTSEINTANWPPNKEG